MASTRKSRNPNKRFSKLNEESPDKDGGGIRSKNRKRKLSDMLGPQWSKEELERFYEAYRKYGKDWKKVAGVIRNRTVDMVEALYNMNKAYLSLADGMATAAGLIAMMTDHYNILEGSDSDRESNHGIRTSIKPQKRGRGKFRLSLGKGKSGSYPDLLQHQPASSSYGCLSLLNKKRSGGVQPRVVGKRTPRFPVYASDRHGGDFMNSSRRHGFTLERDNEDDEGVQVAALALAEASQRGGSPQVSRTPGSRIDAHSSDQKCAEPEVTNSKFNDSNADEECLEGSLGSREAENGDFIKDISHRQDIQSVGKVAVKRKTRKSKGKKLRIGSEQEYDDAKEACSGTEEGRNAKSIKEESTVEFTDEKGAHPSRKSNRKLFFGDESTAFEALQTLADLSLNILAPSSAVESESSTLVKEGKKNLDSVEKPNLLAKPSKNGHGDKVKKKDKGRLCPTGVDVVRKASKSQKVLTLEGDVSPEIKQETSSKGQKRKRKISEDAPQSEALADSCIEECLKTEVSTENGKKSGNKVKRSVQMILPAKQLKSTKHLEHSSSSVDLSKTAPDISNLPLQKSASNETSMPVKSKSRRKISLQKALASKGAKCSESCGENHHRLQDKEKLSHCLSSPLVRQWCIFEWFYSSIDYPWFAKSEFVDYLNHVGLGHVPRLTRVEWGVIRSSLGKPRRLSQHFLQEERKKLEQYRETVRTHYSELRTGTREGLPTDLARPLSVGQRVIACHPKTREIHDGSILTVDRNRCRVQFDRPELGVEFVTDIDCMPLNLLENMPDMLKKRSLGADRLFESLNDVKPYDQPKDWKFGGSALLSSNDNMENGEGPAPSASHPINTLIMQAKGDTIDAVIQAKAAANEVAVATRQAMYTQPYTLAQIQAKEDDIRALAELSRALDKKEALLVELRNMNEEVSVKLVEGESVKDLENFRKQYAMVLLQLREANDLVASALLFLRQRNTYMGNSTPPCSRPLENSTMAAGPPGSFTDSAFYDRDSGSHVLEIVESSRRNARSMVDIAVQAISSVKEGEDAYAKVGEALDSMRKSSSEADSGAPLAKSFLHSNDQGHANSTCPEQATSSMLEPMISTDGHEVKQTDTSDRNGPQIPSELISSCVSTLLMIQRCTEKQYPPAEVAQILESAVQSLMPCCPQNMPIYRDIEDCMGIIKNQMLALVPTPSTSLPLEPTVA